MSKTGITQSEIIKDPTLSVHIDWDMAINKSHPYAEKFKTKNSDYLLWLYFASKEVEDRRFPTAGKKKIYSKSKGNNSLVYTVANVDETFLDTVRNAVHPSDREIDEYMAYLMNKEADNFFTPRIKGELPKGIVTYTSDDRNKFKVGIELPHNKYKVAIQVLDQDGKELIQLVQAPAKKGWNHYEWKNGKFEDGQYILRFQVDDHVRTHGIEVGNAKDLNGFIGGIVDFLDRLF